MRGLVNSDGAPHFTAIDCLFIAYGPGHNGRRRRWERQTARTLLWTVNDGFEVLITGKVEALNGLQQVRR